MKDRDGRTLLSYTAMNGYIAVIIQLLAHDADIEAKSNWSQMLLSYATENGHMAIITQLLAHSVDIEVKSNWS